MKTMILIIDTTSSKTRLAFGDKTIEAEGKQSVILPAMVKEILGGATPSAVGVVVGPGSFTGIRLGIAFAKGLGMGYGIPIAGMNIFEIAAGNAEGEMLAIDSGRGDYFIMENGEYRIEKNLPDGGARLISNYDLADAIKIAEAKSKQAPEPVIPLYIRPSYVDRQ